MHAPARMEALRPISQALDRLMAGLSPGCPEYYALNAALEACRRAERVVGHRQAAEAGRGM